MPPLIGTGNLKRGELDGQVVIVTGSGAGIGYEAARALAWLGARVVIAEINRLTGPAAEASINAKIGQDAALFVHTDIGSPWSVDRMARQARRSFGKVDVVINNAAVEPVGPVKDVPLRDWDLSYRVNLRGVVLLARAFLPEMLARNRGAFICVSSVGGPYIAPYEALKSAQVELARSLDSELEGTGVCAFTIGPGLVNTPGSSAQIPKIARLMGKSVQEFKDMASEAALSVEAAGAGFAAAVALAERFRGLEIGARQALLAAGIDVPAEAGNQLAEGPALTPAQIVRASGLCRSVHDTLAEQAAGWNTRSIFERQWMRRDFKQYAGQTVEQCLEELERLSLLLSTGELAAVERHREVARRVAAYYQHYARLAQDYERDPVKLKTAMDAIHAWQSEAEALAELLS